MLKHSDRIFKFYQHTSSYCQVMIQPNKKHGAWILLKTKNPSFHYIICKVEFQFPNFDGVIKSFQNLTPFFKSWKIGKLSLDSLGEESQNQGPGSLYFQCLC